MDYIKELTKFFEDASIRCKVIFGVKQQDDLRLLYSDVNSEARLLFRAGFLKQFKTMAGKHGEKYSLSDKDKDVYQYVNVAEIPDRVTFFTDAKEKIGELTADLIKSTRFMEFRFQNNHSKIVSVYRINQRTNFLLKGKNSFFWANSILYPVKQDIVVAPPEIHCVIIDDLALIFQRSIFERMFGYSQEFERHAKAVFSHLTKGADYSIEGLDKLEETCYKHISDLRALTRVSQSGNYKTWTFAKIQKLAKDKGLKIVFDESNKTIKFESKRDFLHIFDDDFLSSKYTGRDYLAFRKQEI